MREEGVKRKKCNLSPIKPGLMESLHTGCHPVAVHIYTQTIHRTIQNKQYKENKQYIYIYIYIYIKVKFIPQQPEVAQGVPGRLRPRIFLTFGTTKVVGRQPYAPAAFTPGEVLGTHF